jgi:DNA-directed RNA polymerase specialized sigma54-like protein
MSKELLQAINDKVDSSDSANKYDSKSFLKGLERRRQTLLVVTEYLVEAQSNFLNGSSRKKSDFK